ncbi:MAG: flagellar transcriptional regulator FlhC [Burkholderiales bacterium]
MRNKSMLSEARQIQLASELIRLGARLQVLEGETDLSRERLLKLYKEIKGVSPPKGMLPFSVDWFLSWQANIHSSLFVDIYRFLLAHTDCRGIEAIIKSYKLYLEHVVAGELECVLSMTRAWTLVRFLEGRVLKAVPCVKCGGHFVMHAQDLHANYVCGLCNVPSRAGKTRKARHAGVTDLPKLAA